jgi:hypothetical protein
MMWGFSKPEACTAVGEAAREVFQRTDHTGYRALGEERIEQIYESWRVAAGIRPMRWKYSRDWLRAAAPLGSVTDLALRLLRGETLPKSEEEPVNACGEKITVVVSHYMLNGDPLLTPRSQEPADDQPAPVQVSAEDSTNR